MTLQKLIQEMPQRFDEKISSYDKDGGFIVYVEGYDNQDFDVELIKSFITTYQEELLAAVVEEIDKRIPEDPEAHGWEGIFSIKERCCPGDDFGEGWCRALSDLKNTLLQAKSSGV